MAAGQVTAFDGRTQMRSNGTLPGLRCVHGNVLAIVGDRRLAMTSKSDFRLRNGN